MNKYETVLVVSPDLSEADLKEEIKKIEGQLQSLGAVQIKSDRWGKRELGYIMKRKKTGNYISIRFESPQGKVMDGITSLLRINDKVLKFQSHRLADRVRKFKGNPRRLTDASNAGDDFSDGSEGDFAAQ